MPSEQWRPKNAAFWSLLPGLSERAGGGCRDLLSALHPSRTAVSGQGYFSGHFCDLAQTTWIAKKMMVVKGYFEVSTMRNVWASGTQP